MGPFFHLPSNEESCEQKSADAAVFALKGRRQTMEDRFALVQIPVPHLPDENIVRLFCVMDGHGGQVCKFLLYNFPLKILIIFGHLLQCNQHCDTNLGLGKAGKIRYGICNVI